MNEIRSASRIVAKRLVNALAVLALFVARPSLAQEARDSAAADSVSAASVIVTLSRAALEGPLKLAELRGLPLGDPRTYAVNVPVPDTWTCRMRIEESAAAVRCDVVVPTGMGRGEYDRLVELLEQHVDRRGWVQDDDAAREMMRVSTGMERAVAYALKRDRRIVARTTLSISTGALNARVPRGSDLSIIILSVRAYAR